VLAVLVAACAGGSGLDSLGRAVNAELRGDSARARALYDRVIEAGDLSPRNLAVALANRCALRGEEGDAAGAIADCDRAIAIDPGLALAYTNRGAAYDALGEHGRAIDDHTAAIALAAKGDRDSAVKSFRTSYALAPRHPVVRAKAQALGLGP
jgi:tetratricopeptide (TPR) repeat protein